jgi:hypothetical protein
MILMGVMRFICPTNRIPGEAVEQAYLSGFERVPWQVRARGAKSELVLERASCDSGALHIPWRVGGHGQMTLSTATLTEGSRPYYLPLELARGKISQVRNRLAEWEMVGLNVPKEVHDKVGEALGHFAHAAVRRHDSAPSANLAEQAVRLALDAAHLLAACYTEQALAARRRSAPRLGTFLGANLGLSLPQDLSADRMLEAFNAAHVPFSWREIEASEGHYCWDLSDRQVEWCRAQGLTVCGGPLLQFDSRSLPDWLALYEDDLDALAALASDFIQAVVGRYQSQINVWQCAGRINTADVLSLSEEAKVNLAARAIEITHQLDPNTPALASFDQPWAEYLSRREMDYPPMQFADALIRAQLGLTGLVLEINLGYYPGGTLPRDPLEFSQQLDYWSLLGMPLFLALCVPSASGEDPQAARKASLSPGLWTPQTQQAWVSRYVPLLLAKPYVHGILWNQLRDREAHEFPHGGLFDPQDHPKPALAQLASLRQAHLS